MSSSGFTFPSPVGGVPFPSDFAPSILFAVLYGLLLPVIIWRFWHIKSRTIVVFGTVAFSIERVIVFGLRAAQSRNAENRSSEGLAVYMQTTLAIGYVSIASDLVTLMRHLLSAPANPQRPETVESPQSSNSLIMEATGKSRFLDTSFTQSDNRSNNYAKERARCGYIGLLLPLCWVSIALGSVYGALYLKAKDSPDKARMVQQLRYASSGVNCLIVTLVQLFSVYAAVSIRNINRNHTYLITALATLMNILTVYRLVVMKNETTAIDSLAPGSLNETSAKIAFYIFHVAPEWITSAILLGINVRNRFGTGFRGEQCKSKDKSDSTSATSSA